MATDPFEARRTGVRRLRLITASLGAAAAVGTGALAWSVAAPAASAATEEDATTDDSTTSTSNGDQFVAPSQLPSTTASGGSHASSGGS